MRGNWSITWREVGTSVTKVTVSNTLHCHRLKSMGSPCLSQHMSRPIWSLPETIWMIQRRIGRMSCGQYYSIATQKHCFDCGPWEWKHYDLGLLFCKGQLTRIKDRTNVAMYEFLGKLLLPLVRALRMKWMNEYSSETMILRCKKHFNDVEEPSQSSDLNPKENQ